MTGAFAVEDQMDRRTKRVVNPNSQARCQAFTLVELLVVIGIIAVLVGILLPALNRARAQAYSANCLSNLRDCGNMLQMYANEYQDKVPLGYLNNRRHESYQISSLTTGGEIWYIALGPMYQAKYMADGRSWYCPSPNNIDERWMYATDENPWPPENTTFNCRAGYYFRPAFSWNAKPFAPPPTHGTDASGKKIPNDWPRMSKLTKKAVATDLWPLPLGSGSKTKLAPHGKKLNILWGDRSASTIPMDGDIAAKIDFINGYVAGDGTVAYYQTHFLNVHTDPETQPGLWDLYDRLKK
jgi:prepilin-type N-terminal cleavage/methylation domain-containing protein